MKHRLPARVTGFRWADVQGLAFLLELLCLVAGAVFYFTPLADVTGYFWTAGTAVAVALLMTEIARSALEGNFALDVIAAIAMLGALVLGESLAGIIIATMYLGGQMLENLAQGRVRREMNALLARAPKTASRLTDGHIEEVAVSAIVPGDRILVRRGEIVPVDGTLLSEIAILDQSSLTGEALPAEVERDASLLSGVSNAADSFEMRADKASADSTYTGIIRLVESAQSSKSPIMRVADRYAVAFLGVTLLASAAAWLISGDPHRALAVLVVATPCPLILAVPIAILSGVSRCAARGILVKGGEALERLAEVQTLLLDKTGTITDGRARLVDIRTFDAFDPQRMLQLAASLDQGSHHVSAEAIVLAARDRGLDLETPDRPVEVPGSGIEGGVDAHRIVLGTLELLRSRQGDPLRLAQMEAWARGKGVSIVAVMIDGLVIGGLLMADRIRPEAPTVLRRLRDAGVRRVVLLTGDHADQAASVAATLGLDDVRSELKPQDKIAAVQAEKSDGRVIMVGDGVNDAPALAAADVGVAMGARGAAASSEAADVVLLVDRLDRLVTALRIAQRSTSIARQSAFAGMILSALAMVAAMLGYLPPIGGALLQEAIDVAVILNALRALGSPISLGSHSALTAEHLSTLEDEHRQLADIIDEIRDVADKACELPGDELCRRTIRLDGLLGERLLKHERQDEKELFPQLRADRTHASMFIGLSRTHMEIQRRAHIFGTLVRSLSAEPGEAERRDIQRLLDGLEAITTLHFDEEEEIYRLLESG